LLIRVEVKDDRILFDPVMLKQIASNLVSNAIKFTPQVEVEMVIYQKKTRTEGTGEFVLEVCYSGVGLSADQVRRNLLKH
ncbi:ATP-binding protein, partial [Rhizobium ruizarguesonis]